MSNQHWKQCRMVGVIVAAWMLGVTAAYADLMTTAPVNPRLEEWLANKDGQAAPDGFGYVPEPVDWSHLTAQANKDALPARFDLRDEGALTAVRNQWSCGACWAFAGCGVLESWLKIHHGLSRDFSENHMKNTHGFDMGHCAGGNNEMITAYLARFSGPLNEADDPYRYDEVVPPTPGAQVQRLLRSAPIFAVVDGDRSEIKNAVNAFGPVSASMLWNDANYNNAAKTYYYSGVGSGTGHMIAVVGWDDDKVVPGAPGNGAWICRNSWGSSWGESGYFYLSYHDAEAVKEVRGFYDLAPPDAYGRVYQHDPLGMSGSAGSGANDVAYGANVFTASANEDIVAVGAYAMADNCAYEITLYGNGISGGTFLNPLVSVSGVWENAGYYVVDLPTSVSVSTGQQFAVKVRFQTPGFFFPVPLEKPLAGFSSPTAALGQSYMSADGATFVDIHGEGGGFTNCNACIKAIAAYDEGEIPLPCTEVVSTNVPRPIDFIVNAITESTITVAESRIVSNLSVGLDITYPQVSDLTVNLRSPVGTEITLFANIPKWGANFSNTVLSDGASTSIAAGNPPFTGCFAPQASLGAFSGINAQGVWTLRIQTDELLETGSLTGWRLRFDCDCGEEPGEGEEEGEVEGEVEGETPPPSVYIIGKPRVTVGSTLVLRASVSSLVGAITYRWSKDNVTIPAGVYSAYSIPEVAYEHAGVYRVQVEDESKALFESPPFVLQVLPEGSLPAVGVAALGVLTALMACAGARRVGMRQGKYNP